MVKPFLNSFFMSKEADLEIMGIKFYGKLICLDASSWIHSGLVTMKTLVALFPKKPSCLCFLPVLPFSYSVKIRPAGVLACIKYALTFTWLSLSLLNTATHNSPEIPVVLSASVLQTCLNHLYALLLAGVLVVCGLRW